MGYGHLSTTQTRAAGRVPVFPLADDELGRRRRVAPRARSANAGATSAVRRIRSECGFLFSYSSRSKGTMMATPLALATPTLIGAPPAVSSPNAL
jgi:hypothetical protein